MGSASRAKGLRGEQEVAAVWTRNGFAVRGLESAGDHLCIVGGRNPNPYIPGHSLTIHSEVKRQERLQLWLWIEQAEKEAPPGAVPVVSFRRNRSPWYAAVKLETLAELLS